MGEVYQRLLKDVPPGGNGQVIVDTLMEVSTSWVDGAAPTTTPTFTVSPGTALRFAAVRGESAGLSFRIHEKILWNAAASREVQRRWD